MAVSTPASAPVDPGWWRTSQAEADPIRVQMYQHAVHHLHQAGKVSLPLSRRGRQRVDAIVAKAWGLGLSDAMARIERLARR